MKKLFSFEHEEKYYEMSPFELKNLLIQFAEEGASKTGGKVLNAGRGNPNFLNITVRKAFTKLMLFSCEISHSYFSHRDLGFRPTQKGSSQKLKSYLYSDRSDEAVFLKEALEYAEEVLGLDADELAYELIDASLGDFYPASPSSSPKCFSNGDLYPTPPRIYSIFERITNAYLLEVLLSNHIPEGCEFQLFATEGATAAMIYTFKSLRENGILKKGDPIAILTPIFSPYLEIPALADYRLIKVCIKGSEKKGWQIPDCQIEKLTRKYGKCHDKPIKAIFMVNPTNPTSVVIDKETVKKISGIAKENNMIILTDTVYTTFVDEFYPFIREAPENTICVYSFSKYFGVTGWRLGVIMVNKNNVVDDVLLPALPCDVKEKLNKRYSITTAEENVKEIKFIDRLEMDSRDVALAHTGGLSGPQQTIMTLLCLFNLMDREKKYKSAIQEILARRMKNLYTSLGIAEPCPDRNECTRYYALINLARMAGDLLGTCNIDEFKKYLTVEDLIEKFLIPLAKEKYTVCLPGYGFHGPQSSIRVSLANLNNEDYLTVGRNIKDMLLQVLEQACSGDQAD